MKPNAAQPSRFEGRMELTMHDVFLVEGFAQRRSEDQTVLLMGRPSFQLLGACRLRHTSMDYRPPCVLSCSLSFGPYEVCDGLAEDGRSIFCEMHTVFSQHLCDAVIGDHLVQIDHGDISFRRSGSSHRVVRGYILFSPVASVVDSMLTGKVHRCRQREKHSCFRFALKSRKYLP